MNWLAFWASVIGSLAWPATIIIALLIFRKQVLAAAPWLRELEVGNVKVKFAEELAKAATAAEEIEAAPASAPPTPVTDRDLLLAEHAPLGLVLQGWMSVEHALTDAANRIGLSKGSVAPKLLPSGRLIRELEQHRVITPATAETIDYLRHLRNQAAHHKGFAIDTGQALEYARLARKVIDALNDGPATIPGVAVPG